MAVLKKNAFLLVGILMVICLHRYAQSCGISYTYDSTNYVWASDAWLKKGVLENKDGVVFLQQPPLFPLLLAVGAPYQAVFASWLHTFCLAITLFFCARLGHTYIASRFVYSLYFILLVFASPLYLVHQFLWSEPVFLALLSGHFYSLSLYYRRQGRIHFWVMVVLSALFCLQRSAGIVFVSGTFVVLSHTKNRLCYALACLPFLVWNGYVLLYKTPVEYAQTYGVQDDLWAGSVLLIESIAICFVPLQMPFLGKCLVVLGLFFIIIFILKKEKNKLLTAIGYAIGFYLLLLIVKKSDFSDMERFVAIAYPFILLLLSIGIASYKPTAKYTKIMVLFLCMAAIYPIGRCLKNIAFWQKVRCTQITK